MYYLIAIVAVVIVVEELWRRGYIKRWTVGPR